jgi:hypothetical protein
MLGRLDWSWRQRIYYRELQAENAERSERPHDGVNTLGLACHALRFIVRIMSAGRRGVDVRTKPNAQSSLDHRKARKRKLRRRRQ